MSCEPLNVYLCCMSAISVIIPVYNAEDTIAACVNSVCQQSLKDIEIIIVDDGSADRSGAQCDELALKDERITVIHQVNEGRTAARWKGVQCARSEWLTFVDSDDTLPEDSLHHLLQQATDDVDIVLGNGYTLTEEGETGRVRIPMEDFRHMAVRGDGTIGVPWGSLYRRSVLTYYMFDLPREIMNGEDYLFWLRLVFSTEKDVAVVRHKVYEKGEEHTSNCFVWTAGYAQQLQALRRGSIPKGYDDRFLRDELTDRIANLFDIAVWSPRREWAHSDYVKDIVTDMKSIGMQWTWKQRLFLNIPSLHVRKMVARL